MKKTILIISVLLLQYHLHSQNMVTNPDAESLPRGAGWTIISQGALTCLLSPTNNIINWTMKPDGSSNYPFDHTIGSAGGTVFFSGCSSYFQGPFELQQYVDVSADAALIDLGNQLYTFSGYIKTPVSNQTDQGRFIVDYLNTSNVILGASYTSSWQSFYGGSGTSWVYYTSSRIAPAGTRKINIRMQTEMLINQPAINVYFDDISLTRPSVLPVRLISFTGKEVQGDVHLDWTITDAQYLKHFELEFSTDASHFNPIATIQAGKTNYHFADRNNNHSAGLYYYRLKMTGTDGKKTYSNIIMIKTTHHAFINVSTDPGFTIATVNGSFQKGNLSIINSSGKTVLTTHTISSPVRLDISRLPAGMYVVRFSDSTTVINKKLLIHQK